MFTLIPPSLNLNHNKITNSGKNQQVSQVNEGQSINLKTCPQCDQEISIYQSYVEFDCKLYHSQCFNCKLCLKMFAMSNDETSSNSNIFPIKDKQCRLFCINDFVR